MDCGPVVDKCDGLKECDGLVANPSGMVGSNKENRPDDDNVGQLASVREIDRGDLMGKRHRKIEECYPKELAEIWAKRGQLVTARTKLRQGRREMARMATTETVERDFLWGEIELKKKISWVNWDSVCCSRGKGGLRVLDLRMRSWALLGKWWARFGDGVESLWKQVVWEKYFGGKREADIIAVETVKVFKIWSDVIKIGGMSAGLRNMVVKGFRWELGDGSRVGFWREIWVGDKLLRDLCPRLYELAIHKEGMVSEMGEWEGDRWRWNMEWKRERSGRVRDEEEVFWEMLGPVQLKKGREDSWRLVPSKVSFFGWRLCLDRLPTKVAWSVWVQVLHWWGIEAVLSNTIEGVAKFFPHGLGKIIEKEMGASIFLAVSWYLWYCRNMGVFKYLVSFTERVVDMVQANTFF
ncbi:hypothetical protein SLEP1_g50869 [Rubroshorea leprosula]|uniref:Reverse transcriptase zinc-binding domain-containing protein n=1 Tax=Rubroshorea leprosula TaxID=152421 RepID=A0AAV5M3I2_9ROSI|nr:hypothetical protein SLEP1_g50869 [Rubroshorea leprosula]